MRLDDLDDLDVAALAGEPARSRQLRAQGRSTIRRLIEAGLSAVEERGHDEVRVDDVVSRADVSHGTFYLYFRDQDDLLASLVRLVAVAVEPLAATLPANPTAASLAAWWDDAERTFDEHVEILRAAQALGDETCTLALVPPLADALDRAGGRDTGLVAEVVLRHFAQAIVRAEVLASDTLAAVTLRACGVAVDDEVEQVEPVARSA